MGKRAAWKHSSISIGSHDCGNVASQFRNSLIAAGNLIKELTLLRREVNTSTRQSLFDRARDSALELAEKRPKDGNSRYIDDAVDRLNNGEYSQETKAGLWGYLATISAFTECPDPTVLGVYVDALYTDAHSRVKRNSFLFSLRM